MQTVCVHAQRILGWTMGCTCVVHEFVRVQVRERVPVRVSVRVYVVCVFVSEQVHVFLCVRCMFVRLHARVPVSMSELVCVRESLRVCVSFPLHMCV